MRGQKFKPKELRSVELCWLFSWLHVLVASNMLLRRRRLRRRVTDMLTSVLGLSATTSASLVRQFPALLSADKAPLASTCARLQAVLATFPPWQVALDTAPPVHIRVCLYYGPKVCMHHRGVCVWKTV